MRASLESKEYIKQLDGLRFIAVLMVMISHWVQHKLPYLFLRDLPFIHGVTLFFVISGFLITKILIINREKYEALGINKKKLLIRFYIRRVLRIFPLYYFVIFTFFVIDFENTREIFVYLVTYTINIYQSIENVYVGRFNHFWSLAVEEQFYIFWPLLILFSKRKNIIKTIVVVVIIALFTRILLYICFDNWMATSYFTLSCMFSIGVGGLLAYFSINNSKIYERIKKKRTLLVISIIYIIGLTLNSIFPHQWYKEILDWILFTLLASVIIGIASENGFKSIIGYLLEFKPIVFAGKISYGMYVFHLFAPVIYKEIMYFLGFQLDINALIFIIYYLITFILSYISWVIIESPINNLKKRFQYM